MQTAEDCLNANSGGLPHSKERRTASMQTAEDCLIAKSGGLPESKERRTASKQTAEDCLKADSTLRYSETLSFLLGFVRRLLLIKTFRKEAMLPSAGSHYEPLCCTPYKYRLSLPEAGRRNIVLISPIRRRQSAKEESAPEYNTLSSTSL